jgi:hypothetical protein
MAKKRKRRRGAPTSRQRVDHRRGVVFDITGDESGPYPEPHLGIIVEPVRLDDGRALWFQAPHVAPMFLLKAKQLRDAAEPKRARTIARVIASEEGGVKPIDGILAFDALEDLALTVIIALAAIEAHANDMIGRLPDDAMVEVPTRLPSGGTMPVMRAKPALDWLALHAKVAHACPALHGTASIVGSPVWAKFVALSRLRNQVVHQRRKAYNDPRKPSVFGRLLRGDGSKAPEDAFKVIEALEPGYLPERVRDELG